MQCLRKITRNHPSKTFVNAHYQPIQPRLYKMKKKIHFEYQGFCGNRGIHYYLYTSIEFIILVTVLDGNIVAGLVGNLQYKCVVVFTMLVYVSLDHLKARGRPKRKHVKKFIYIYKILIGIEMRSFKNYLN